MAGRYGLEIRTATAADAPGLAELLGGSGFSIDARSVAERLDRIRQGSGTVLIAAEWGPPSGVIALHWHATLQDAQASARISLLLVAADDRRRGVGRVLLKAAAQAARSAGCGDLHIEASNEPGLLGFCRATGFTDAAQGLIRPLRKSR